MSKVLDHVTFPEDAPPLCLAKFKKLRRSSVWNTTSMDLGSEIAVLLVALGHHFLAADMLSGLPAPAQVSNDNRNSWAAYCMVRIIRQYALTMIDSKDDGHEQLAFIQKDDWNSGDRSKLLEVYLDELEQLSDYLEEVTDKEAAQTLIGHAMSLIDLEVMWFSYSERSTESYRAQIRSSLVRLLDRIRSHLNPGRDA